MLFKNINFILVRPQLGENIGAAARSLKNFNFENLRLVSPRDSWPNKRATYTAVDAKDIVHKAKVFLNNDQAGSTTTITGATNGLRGLNMYTSAAASAYGTSGTAITNGIHSIATYTQAAAALSYNDLSDMARLFPAQYWNTPSTAWMMHPATIHELRNLSASGVNLTRLFNETGTDNGGAVTHIFGFPVIPNPNMSVTGAGNFNIYLASWENFGTIADVEEMTVQAFEQTAPGFITLYAERRMVSTVRDPFAGIRLVGV